MCIVCVGGGKGGQTHRGGGWERKGGAGNKKGQHETPAGAQAHSTSTVHVPCPRRSPVPAPCRLIFPSKKKQHREKDARLLRQPGQEGRRGGEGGREGREDHPLEVSDLAKPEVREGGREEESC